MLISEKYNFIFVHIYKNAGTSITHALRPFALSQWQWRARQGLEILGIPMVGERLNVRMWEDREICFNLNNKQELENIIIKRNNAHKIWGFKYPNLDRYFDMFSRISVEGVPGYAVATFTPDSYAPRAIASLPVKSFFSLFSFNNYRKSYYYNNKFL